MTWKRCSCGSYGMFWFYNPDQVVCHGCYSVVGHTDEEIESDLVHLDYQDDVVRSSETEEAVAGVEWDDDVEVLSAYD